MTSPLDSFVVTPADGISCGPGEGLVRHRVSVNLLDRKVVFEGDGIQQATGCTKEEISAHVLDVIEVLRADRMEAASDEYDATGAPDGDDTHTGALDELYEKHGVDDLLETRVFVDVPAPRPATRRKLSR